MVGGVGGTRAWAAGADGGEDRHPSRWRTVHPALGSPHTVYQADRPPRRTLRTPWVRGSPRAVHPRHLDYSDGELRRRTVLSAGTLIADRYQLEVPLGRGGMDEVRRATYQLRQTKPPPPSRPWAK